MSTKDNRRTSTNTGGYKVTALNLGVGFLSSSGILLTLAIVLWANSVEISRLFGLDIERRESERVNERVET